MPDDTDAKVREIYNQLWTKTGQSIEKLPLVIDDSDIDNAYNDGTKIVIFRGLINKCNSWDEIALILGHEIAHGTLRHVYFGGFNDPYEANTAEADADKMGAFYMMAIGYDVCKGREVYNRWLQEKGDYIGGSHPTYSYRYNALNINCK